jgi:D-sedoheptulose 7-phosphate isomerase
MGKMRETVKEILGGLFGNYPELAVCRDSIKKSFELLKACYDQGGKVLVCGNGGSASDSEHIVGELMKGFILKRKIAEKHRTLLHKAFPEDGEYLADHLQGALPAVSLVSQSAISTAFINDVAADMVFAQQVYGYGKEGDVLIALSTSGNSKNVLNAVKIAKTFGIATIGFSGGQGGKMMELCDATIVVPAAATYRVQEYHLPVYHALCSMIEAEYFDE